MCCARILTLLRMIGGADVGSPVVGGGGSGAEHCAVEIAGAVGAVLTTVGRVVPSMSVSESVGVVQVWA